MRVSFYLRSETRVGRRVALQCWAGGHDVWVDVRPVVSDGYVYLNDWLAPMLNAAWHAKHG